MRFIFEKDPKKGKISSVRQPARENTQCADRGTDGDAYHTSIISYY